MCIVCEVGGRGGGAFAHAADRRFSSLLLAHRSGPGDHCPGHGVSSSQKCGTAALMRWLVPSNSAAVPHTGSSNGAKRSNASGAQRCNARSAKRSHTRRPALRLFCTASPWPAHRCCASRHWRMQLDCGRAACRSCWAHMARCCCCSSSEQQQIACCPRPALATPCRRRCDSQGLSMTVELRHATRASGP